MRVFFKGCFKDVSGTVCQLSRARGEKPSCGEQRKDGTVEENSLFFCRLPVQSIPLSPSISPCPSLSFLNSTQQVSP